MYVRNVTYSKYMVWVIVLFNFNLSCHLYCKPSTVKNFVLHNNYKDFKPIIIYHNVYRLENVLYSLYVE